MADRKQTLARLVEMVKDIDIALFTTVGAGGYLVTRPLSTQATSFDGETVWFFTEADTPKVAEVQRNGKVNVAYASKDRNTYVSLAGDARPNRDRAMIDRLWNDMLKAFFPKGKDDPNLILIEFRPRTAQYWDGPSSFVGKALSFIAARVTGNDDLMGANKLVDVRTGKATTPPSADGVTGKRKLAARRAAKAPLQGTRTSAKKTGVKRSAAKKSAKSGPAMKQPMAKKPAARPSSAKKSAGKAARQAPARKSAAGAKRSAARRPARGR